MSSIQSLIESNNGQDTVFDPSGLSGQLLEDAVWLQVRPDDIVEAKADGEIRFYLNGRLGLVEQATANKRVYTKKVMGREIARLAEDMAAKGVYGECDHPSDGKTKLSRVSHYVLGAEINENNEIVGKLEIIPESIMGKQILAIAKTGGRLGVSSRGFGSVQQNDNGEYVVQEDYKLATWDIVADPANAGAHPAFVSESKEEKQSMDIAKLMKENPELVEAIRTELSKDVAPEAREHAREALREEFDGKLKELGEDIQAKAEEKVRKEMLEDPEVAAAKGVVDQIKALIAPQLFEEDENKEITRLNAKVADLEKRLAESDERVREIEEERDSLADATKEMAYTLYLEKNLDEDVDTARVLEKVGDLKQYDDVNDFREAVDTAVASMQEEIEAKKAREQELKERDEKIAQLEKQLDEAREQSNAGYVRAYVEKKIATHPRRTDARSYILEAAPMTRKRVDELLKAYDAEHPLSEEYKGIRRGLKSALVESDGEGDRDELQESADDEANVMGVPMSQLK